MEQWIRFRRALAWVHFCSMGLRSGEYDGRYSKICPAFLIMVCVMEFIDGKVKNELMFFDTGLLPAEAIKQMNKQAA